MYSAFQSNNLAIVSGVQIINSFNSSFSCKDRNIRGIENWDSKPFMFGYIPTPPPFQEPVIYYLEVLPIYTIHV